jgi:hypothetical protein
MFNVRFSSHKIPYQLDLIKKLLNNFVRYNDTKNEIFLFIEDERNYI